MNEDEKMTTPLEILCFPSLYCQARTTYSPRGQGNGLWGVLATTGLPLRGYPLQVIDPLDPSLTAFPRRAGDNQLGGDGGFAARWVSLEEDCDVVDLLGPRGVYGAHGEGRVLHDVGEVHGVEEDVLERNDDVVPCSDQEGPLGLGGQSHAKEGDDVFPTHE